MSIGLIFRVGADVPLAFYPVDDTGAPANGTTVAVTVTAPDGTSVTPSTPVSVGTGQYSAIVPSVAQAGVYLVRYVVSSSTFSWVGEDQFTVEAQSGLHVVDIASVRAHLNLDANRVHDDELLGFILAADEQARDMLGPIAIEQHTQWCDGGRSQIGLDWNPVQSIVSVTEYYGLSAFAISNQPLGSQTNAFGYTVDTQVGVLTRRTFGGASAMWAIGQRNIKVVYTAGMGNVPFTVRMGALELIRFWYQRTQQGGRKRNNGMDATESVPMGFAMPDFVVEAWAPYRRPPGIA